MAFRASVGRVGNPGTVVGLRPGYCVLRWLYFGLPMCATTTRTGPASYTLFDETMNNTGDIVVVRSYIFVFSALADLRVELVLPLAKSLSKHDIRAKDCAILHEIPANGRQRGQRHTCSGPSATTQPRECAQDNIATCGAILTFGFRTPSLACSQCRRGSKHRHICVLAVLQFIYYDGNYT